MNTQALNIARAMKLNVVSEDPLMIYHDGVTVEWNPAQNPVHFQMVEDWVVEQGYRIIMERRKYNTQYMIMANSLVGKAINPSKPLAFLQAVEQLIDNQTKQPDACPFDNRLNK